ncbi:MAG TPA: class I SAM-dependent methyltransferase [Flavobacteriales bacterium]|jgi:2-polyprenyl-3-methyl-5-hydroxy-6-metoxy-1,4-benzoquinol methylase|nr:class I SAM-dependent methyltransferase [Flavobacteriales bacterium]
MSNVFDADKERDFLNGLVKDYTDSSPYSEIKKDIIVRLMLDRMPRREGNGLQFGCANGFETGLLAQHLRQLDVVDGSSVFIERLKQEKATNISYHCALFEDYDHASTGATYDYLSCNYILEHVFDTQVVLQNIRGLMHAESLLFVTVPNSDALSRRLALQMGLIPSLSALTENDHRHGHRRTYTFASIKADVQAAGFEIVEESGIVLKILADFQLNKLLKDGFLTEAHIRGLQAMAASPECIAFSDSIFLVLRRTRA